MKKFINQYQSMTAKQKRELKSRLRFVYTSTPFIAVVGLGVMWVILFGFSFL